MIENIWGEPGDNRTAIFEHTTVFGNELAYIAVNLHVDQANELKLNQFESIDFVNGLIPLMLDRLQGTEAEAFTGRLWLGWLYQPNQSLPTVFHLWMKNHYFS